MNGKSPYFPAHWPAYYLRFPENGWFGFILQSRSNSLNHCSRGYDSRDKVSLNRANREMCFLAFTTISLAQLFTGINIY